MTARAPIQSSLIFLLYLIARLIGFPLLVLYLLYRGYRDSRYFHNFRERFGHLPDTFKRTPPGSVWLHAVSVGEVITGVRLIEELRKANPHIPIYLSTTTLAGRAVAQKKAATLADGIFFAPFDYGFAVQGVLKTIRPSVVVVLETEIWPMLFREAKRSHCGLIGLNGRISDRAFPRYQRFRWAFAPVLALPDCLFVQSEQDRRRYITAGAPASKVQTFGNLKYDAAPTIPVPPALVTELIDLLQPKWVWVAASTMPGRDASDVDEDDLVVEAFRRLTVQHPKLLMILVPRRPERFAGAADKLRKAGIGHFRRSEDSIPRDLALPCALVVDTIGELSSLFPLADVVFMGGTLARRGGHNVLEPAICQKPIIVGPHMENFADIAEAFEGEEAWLRIPDGEALAGAVDQLLNDRARRDTLGKRAAALAGRNTGVAERAAVEILRAQDSAIPLWNRAILTYPLLWGLAQLWKLGNRSKQQRDVARSLALDHPVISVGGIAMGGTGKTPFVEMLARNFRERGLQPAILTRGYRRRSLDQMILVRAGSSVSTWYTGDEAQIFVRSGQAHIGIGADRWATGQEVEKRLHPDLFLLDDGFQHRRLQRSVDIVLIDALDPFPGGGVFPLGRMREPLQGLQRADVFVITRAQPGREYTGIRDLLRRINPAAPVFLASVGTRGWISEKTRLPTEPAGGPVIAFSGLGNPATFWHTLRDQRFDPVLTWTFGDHHSYRPKELKRLAEQSKALGVTSMLTTEKDAMNLPEDAAALVAPLEIYWLKIATEMPDESALMDLIMRRTAGDPVAGHLAPKASKDTTGK